jgi:three-Cys-motif partner protein
MQVPWTTIEMLGGTKAIEVIINLPVGMAIQRLLKRTGEFTQSQRAKLDTYFGSSDWFGIVYQETTGLFGATVDKYDHAAKRLVNWYRDRLKAVFGFASTARLIRSPRGHHLYYLVWAGPNQTGLRIADHVLKQGERA